MLKIVAGFGLALVTFSATAAVQADVWIGTPQIEVFDLNAFDGFSANFVEGGPRVGAFDEALRPAPYASSSSGAAAVFEAEDSLSGHAAGQDASFVGIGDRYAQSFTYTVTPNTRVTVQAPYQLRVDAGEPASPHASNGGFASFELTVMAVQGLQFGNAGEDPQYTLLHHGVETAILSGDAHTPLLGQHERSGVLSITFENRNDTAAVFAYRGEMVVWGLSAGTGSPVTPPVPEPGSVALMLAGLGAVAWRVRRLRRRG